MYTNNQYTIGKYNLKPELELQVPDEVLSQNGFRGSCIAHSNLAPHVQICAHNCQITKQSTIRLQGLISITNTYNNILHNQLSSYPITITESTQCIVIPKVRDLCVHLFLEAKVLPTQKDVTVPKGFPFTLAYISWDLNTIINIQFMRKYIACN